MELYYQLSIVEARKRSIQLPTPKQLRNAFNDLFVGSLLKDRHGGDLAPRAERHATAFGSKFNRMFPELKARLNECVGKRGEAFMPEITFEMMQLYKVKKGEMAEKGIKSDFEDAGHVEQWQRLFTWLYDNTGGEEQDLTQEDEAEGDDDEEDEVSGNEEEHLTQEQQENVELAEKESDAIAALVSLANASAGAQVALSSHGQS